MLKPRGRRSSLVMLAASAVTAAFVSDYPAPKADDLLPQDSVHLNFQDRVAGPLSPAIAPADGEASELYPGGPVLQRLKNTLRMSLGTPDQGGSILATYRADSSLERIETFNERGKRIVWTEYRPSPERKGTVIETAYDLEESGKPTRWERTEPDSADPKKVAQIEEVWSPITGQRKVTSRRTIVAVQNCDVAAAQAVSSSIDAIAQRYQSQAACPASTGSNLSFSDGSHPFVAAGPVCLDTNCPYDRTAFDRLVRETIQEGASCLASLGVERLAANRRAGARAALGQIGSGARVTNANAQLLSQSFALRNAAQLLMLYNQSQNFGATWNANQQNFMGVRNGDLTAETGARITSRFAQTATDPIKFVCPSGGITYTDSNLGRDFEFGTSLSGGTLASAGTPGSAGWPIVMVRRNLMGSSGTSVSRSGKSVMFHEFMHMIGFPHSDNVAAEDSLGGATVPAHTACQSCCFPDTFTKDNAPASCQATGTGSIQEHLCKMCAGDFGTTHAQVRTPAFQTARTTYLAHMRRCYRIGDPQ